MADSDTNLNNMLLFLETIPNQSKYTPFLLYGGAFFIVGFTYLLISHLLYIACLN